MSVGVHPQNRDGLMLNAADVHQLLDSISQVGFVPARIDAIAVEIRDEEHRVYNQRLVDAAGGALGTMDSKLLKVLSLSASHTNFVLRLRRMCSPPRLARSFREWIAQPATGQGTRFCFR